MRLGILTSHPIQYQAPWFRGLAKEVDLKVFFAHRPDSRQQGEGFDREFTWDIDLLSGYEHKFLANVSENPGTSTFRGCDTPEISDCITTEKFDAFIVTGWHLRTYRQAVKICRAAGIPVLVRGDSHLLTPRSLPKRAAMEIRQRLLLRQFDGFLSAGKRNREYLTHFGVPENKIFFAPHFVDNQWFAAEAEKARGQRLEIRKRWNVAADAFCVLFCGKLIKKKRPLDLVKAAQSLARDGRLPNIHLLFVGSGELDLQLREQCNAVFDKDYSVLRPHRDAAAPQASFVGFRNQSELPECYVVSDVLVLPSASETWGLTVNEAMACGLPAVVSDAVGSEPDLIEQGRTGFSYAVGDVEALADRLARMTSINTKEWSENLKAKCSRYDVTEAINGTLNALSGARAR